MHKWVLQRKPSISLPRGFTRDPWDSAKKWDQPPSMSPMLRALGWKDRGQRGFCRNHPTTSGPVASPETQGSQFLAARCGPQTGDTSDTGELMGDADAQPPPQVAALGPPLHGCRAGSSGTRTSRGGGTQGPPQTLGLTEWEGPRGRVHAFVLLLSTLANSAAMVKGTDKTLLPPCGPSLRPAAELRRSLREATSLPHPRPNGHLASLQKDQRPCPPPTPRAGSFGLIAGVFKLHC